MRITSSERSSRYVCTTATRIMLSIAPIACHQLLSTPHTPNKREAKWVIEDKSGAVFALVGLVLRLIPLESNHLKLHYPTHIQHGSKRDPA